MTTPDFARLRSGKPDCPSDLMLDRYAAHELSVAAAESVRVHIESCSACPQRLQDSRFEAMPEIDPRAMLARIRQGLDRPQSLSERAVGWLKQLGAARIPLALAVGAAALLVVVPLVRRESSDGPDAPDSIRQKGGLMLRVYRQKKPGSEEVLSGSRFAPGDVLRFVIDVPSAGQVTVLGIEQSGAIYTAWPIHKDGQNQELMRQTAGRGKELPGAITLDTSTGRETLYLVHCPIAAGEPRCQSRGATDPPACAAGCAVTPFVLNKVRAR